MWGGWRVGGVGGGGACFGTCKKQELGSKRCIITTLEGFACPTRNLPRTAPPASCAVPDDGACMCCGSSPGDAVGLRRGQADGVVPVLGVLPGGGNPARRRHVDNHVCRATGDEGALLPGTHPDKGCPELVGAHSQAGAAKPAAQSVHALRDSSCAVCAWRPMPPYRRLWSGRSS